MTRFLIVEERASGHLLVFVRVVAEHALAAGHSVIVALPPSARASSEFSKHLSGLLGRVQWLDLVGVVTPATVNVLARESQADVAVVPHGDELATRYAFSLGVRPLACAVRLLIMRDPRWEKPAPLQRRFRNAVKLALVRLASLKRGVEVVWLREPSFTPGSSTQSFAIDPFIADGSWEAIDAEAAHLRSNLKMHPDVFWFGMTGAITDRKNLPMVLKSLALFLEARPDAQIGFAIIGPIVSDQGLTADWVRAETSRLDLALVIVNRLLSNFEMNAAVAALDAVVMAYSTHSPNSTLGKAHVLGTRLVAAGPPSVRGFVRALDAGWESVLEATAMAENLELAWEAAPPAKHPDAIPESGFARSLLGLESTESARAGGNDL
ncbi:hypothetical protein [Marisediminicola antarctica]|uniref:Glycosyltransferase n=1 Tax=Marisediminicola antarctica TaxID=674079 RepID=A0A7L5AEL4_9MICO|nr:hypothetical protein [Marisediminicola antarctica]QHO68810.1 hypothetical protein BHD05_03305 [Marisediminicola antarctica]